MSVAAVQEADSVKTLRLHHEHRVREFWKRLVIYEILKVLSKVLGRSKLRGHKAAPVAVRFLRERKLVGLVRQFTLFLLNSLRFSNLGSN